MSANDFSTILDQTIMLTLLGGIYVINSRTLSKAYWWHPFPLSTNIVRQSRDGTRLTKVGRHVASCGEARWLHRLDGHWAVTSCVDRPDTFHQTNNQF